LLLGTIAELQQGTLDPCNRVFAKNGCNIMYLLMRCNQKLKRSAVPPERERGLTRIMRVRELSRLTALW
jgi:hypothetical protein